MSIIEEGRLDHKPSKSQENMVVMMIIDDCSLSA